MIYINDKKLPWKKMTLGELLEDYCKKECMEIPAVVRINNRLVSRNMFDKIVVEDNSKIYIIPMIAGG